MTKATYDNCKIVHDIIRKKTNLIPKIGIICGSGLGGIGDLVQNGVSFSYSELPGFHVSEVAGHKSKLILGQINGVNVVCMQGRFHGYEGISYDTCAFPIRVMKLLGIEYIIVTHAAGGLNPDFKIGDFMVIKDHLPVAMWANNGPLTGPNESKFGPRFPPMSNAYNKKLSQLVFQTAQEMSPEFHQTIKSGVVVMSSGPTYETVAEAKFFRMMGGDTAGMSICPEVIVAHHCGIKILAMSMVTNMCQMSYEDDKGMANHLEVIELFHWQCQLMTLL